MRKMKAAGIVVILTGLFLLFRNADVATPPILGTLGADAVCNRRPPASALVYYNAMKSGGLNHHEILHHAATRLGFGVSPIGPVNDFAANDCTTVFLSEEIARQLATLNTIQDEPHVLKLREALLPLTTFSNYEINQTVTRFQQLDTKLHSDGHLWTWARTSTAQEMTLRELLGSQTVTNGVLIDRQVNIASVLNQFWFNHFNVDASKAEQYFYGNDSYPQTLRKSLGLKFNQLAMAALKHPAMIVYLDNRENTINATTKVASNQNLAREVLELYTLGVGPSANVYIQKDIEAMAQILAGWNAYPYANQTSLAEHGFVFNSALAAKFPVEMMGRTYQLPAETRLARVVKMLANHAHTKTNLCGKLSLQFMHESLWTQSNSVCVANWGVDGDLAAVYRGLFASHPFWSRTNYRSLYRTPIELPVATARALGINILDSTYAVHALGMDATKFNPQNTTPTSFFADQKLVLNSAPSRTFVQIHAQIENLLGHRRCEAAPPTGIPYLGRDYLSSSFVDNVSRLGIEIGTLFSGMNSASRSDLVAEAEGNFIRTRLNSTGTFGAASSFSQERLKQRAILPGVDGASAYKLLPSHLATVIDVIGNPKNQPKWPDGVASVQHGAAGALLSTAEFLMK